MDDNQGEASLQIPILQSFSKMSLITTTALTNNDLRNLKKTH